MAERTESEIPRSQRIRVIYRSRPEDPPAAAAPTDSEEEDHGDIAIPSNQLAVPPPAPTASPSRDRPHGSRDYPNPIAIAIPTEETQDEEDDGWSFLTQFIGPPPSDDRRPKDGGIATAIVDQERTHFRLPTSHCV